MTSRKYRFFQYKKFRRYLATSLKWYLIRLIIEQQDKYLLNGTLDNSHRIIGISTNDKKTL